MQQQANEQAQALEQIKGVYEDGFADINGRRYTYHTMRHLDRREVFAFFTTIQKSIPEGDFGFLSLPGWAKVEGLISKACSCDGVILDRCADWWDQHPEDYLLWVSTSLAVTSYPFLAGARTGSGSNTKQPLTGETRSRKPM